MTASEFRALCEALFHNAEGWQSALARKLDINPRTVRRWVKNGPTEQGVQLVCRAYGLIPPDRDYPRDEWIVGDGAASERKYLVHAIPPRFSARVVRADRSGVPAPEEAKVDIWGITYARPDYLLCEIVWFDAAPADTGDLRRLFEAAAKALNR